MSLLNLEIIENSPSIKVNGEEIVDLTSSILNNDIKLVFNDNDKKYQVGYDMICKPSVLSQFVFGSPSKLDYLAYYNGFSNPFAIPAGYLLRIPELTRILSAVGSSNSSNSSNVARDLLNKKKSVVDEKRKRVIGYDVENPNMNKTTKSNTVLSDRIILGTNSTVNTNKIKNVLYKEEADVSVYGLVDYFEESLNKI